MNKISTVIENVEKVIIGKRSTIELVLTALLAEGHVLIEDVPGVGKTQLVEAVARSLGGDFNRLQMTPDVMPGDITGYYFMEGSERQLTFRKGAAFCHFLLADEINRASPKSQSALLEIMEENQVSVDGHTYELPKPYMVFATQNPVETYGTFHLPEAQLDRFLMKITMGYPDKNEEIAIIGRDKSQVSKNLQSVMNLEEVRELIDQVEKVLVSDLIEKYIVELVAATRDKEGIRLGVSPRGSLALYKASKAYAFIQGRDYVLPDDIKFLAPFVLSHRMILSPSGKSKWQDAKWAVEEIINTVKVPV